MKFIRKSYLCFALVLFAHRSLCQQSPAYSTASGQTKLDDIERDNLKTQPHLASAPVQPQYIQYTTPDQFVYQLQPHPQQVQYAVQQTQGQQNAAPTPLLAAAAPNQPQTVYTAAAPAGPQQPVIYFTQNGQPIDFSGITFYPAAAAGYPYVPTNGPATGKTVATAPSASKTVQPHVPNAYLVPSGALQQYYQPIALSQPPNSQYFYNTLYQLQSPQKSVYSAGVKSTTPAIPVKSKDEQFAPVGGGGSNYFVANPSPFDKIRITGRV